ncbi:MAG: phosphatidate cytidylyltransferase [Crocinitomicaceae bacterium]
MNIFDYFIPKELLIAFSVIFGVLIICSVAFRIWHSRTKKEFQKELIVRVDSWWKIVAGVTLVTVGPSWMGIILIAYVSFVALREMMSIGRLRSSDRLAMLFCYLAIPVQYYLIHINSFYGSLIFIPLIMFATIAIVLVLTGDTELIGRSMSILPAMLMLTVFFLSHLAFLYNVPTAPKSAGSGGLILFVIGLTAFNDVFQFTCGKLFGKHKILPKISPNKTWEGFIGGILLTATTAFAIQVLTPLEGWQAFLMGLSIGIVGFLGDVLISAIKRDLKLKDTSDLIPGHGGAMDRLDSIVFTAPLFFHLLILFLK